MDDRRRPPARPADVPADWELLPPGDAAATRRVKAGPHHTVTEKRGRKVFSHGTWAPAATIARVRAELDAERSTQAHANKLAASRARRDREQGAYVVEFEAAVRRFLAFPAVHADVAADLARRVAAHATPVGSGTVARTERIPVAERAEAAVIAWMRHQTTLYDHLHVARVKGARREVRRQLAAGSRAVLQRYRDGLPPAPGCPLKAALDTSPAVEPTPAPAPAPAPDRAALFARLRDRLR